MGPMLMRGRCRFLGFWLTLGAATTVAPVVVSAQGEPISLDEDCVVSILNRTTVVQPDGVWTIPNIPADQGPVRARATCVKDGVTLSGESDYFTIPANTGVDVPEFFVGQPAPVW